MMGSRYLATFEEEVTTWQKELVAVADVMVCFIRFHPVSSGFILFHPVSSCFILFHPVSSCFILFAIFTVHCAIVVQSTG